MAFPLVWHRYGLYPLYFIVLSGILLFVVTAVAAVGVADATIPQILPSVIPREAAAPRRDGVFYIPFDYREFCEGSVTMSSVYGGALLCALSWIVAASRRGWRVYVVLMMKDVRLIEKTVWMNAPDLRGLAVPGVKEET